MKRQAKNIQAHKSPNDPHSMQLTYESGGSRRLHFLPSAQKKGTEPEPHGAGSFHDPEHHHILMDRVETMLKRKKR